jgi:hypothetical protein
MEGKRSYGMGAQGAHWCAWWRHMPARISSAQQAGLGCVPGWVPGLILAAGERPVGPPGIQHTQPPVDARHPLPAVISQTPWSRSSRSAVRRGGGAGGSWLLTPPLCCTVEACSTSLLLSARAARQHHARTRSPRVPLSHTTTNPSPVTTHAPCHLSWTQQLKPPMRAHPLGADGALVLLPPPLQQHACAGAAHATVSARRQDHSLGTFAAHRALLALRHICRAGSGGGKEGGKVGAAAEVAAPGDVSQAEEGA